MDTTIPTPIHRLPWADLLRVLATFGVILIHCSGDLFNAFDKVPLDRWVAANAWDSLARMTVPLFAMLSGALLLSPQLVDVPVRFKSIGRRVLKMLLPLLVWSVFYSLATYAMTKQPILPKTWLAAPAMYHMWFVYMIIGLYLMLPILQPIFSAFMRDRRVALYFFALWFICNGVVSYKALPTVGLLYMKDWFGYGGYFLLGAILRYMPIKWPTITLWAGLALSVGVTFCFTVIKSFRHGAANEMAYWYFTPNVIFAAFFCFLLVQRVTVPVRWQPLLASISQSMFFVFFIHAFLLRVWVQYYPETTVMHAPIHPLVGLPLQALVIFLVGLGIATLARKLPYGKSVFG